LRIVLINGIHTEWDDENVLIGRANYDPSDKGSAQADNIASWLHVLDFKFDLITVDSNQNKANLTLSHKIRIASKNHYLLYNSIFETPFLAERDFGVLSGTRFPLNSDIFTHTRICPEKGETVAQCRDRFSLYANYCLKNEKNIIALSYPFQCQIGFNYLLRKKITNISEFWMKRTSISIFEHEKFGWKLTEARNIDEDKPYSEEECASQLKQK